MYILQYDYVAFILNIINLSVFIFYKNLRDAKSKVLFAMLINSMLATIFDILSTMTLNRPEIYPRWYSFFVTNFYYLLNNNKVYIYIFYILLVAGVVKSFSIWRKCIVILPYFITTIMILINPFTHLMFNIDANLVYQRGPGLLILYILALVSMVFWSMYAFRYMKVMNILDAAILRALVTFIIVSVISMAWQTLFPRYLVQGIGTVLCELLLIMVLQNRNEVIDGATQMYSQNVFYNKLQVVFKSNSCASVTLIMLEDIARINYTLGYAYLNIIFQEVARFFKNSINVDERFYIRDGCFALLSLNDLDKQYSEARDRIANRFMDNWHINDLSIKLSAKICQLRFPEQIKSYSDVYDYIDHLIMSPSSNQKDKHSGINEIGFSNYKRQQDVKRAITAAMANHSFKVYYQPIYSVKKRQYISAEALVRLRDPELGFIPPDEFIPLTERDGTITKLGMQIFETVCSFLKHASLDESGIQFIEVNLSAVQCLQRDLLEQLLAVMDKYHISPSQICLEITETVAVKSAETVHTLFQDMQERGISLALDDYGSGYSNVNYILEFPFHFVKLDKQFVWNSFKDDNCRVMLESTIAMIKGLNIEIIAEGVETREQAETLEKLGVGYLQGYYFSRPIPQEEFIDFIAEKNVS